MSNSYRQRFLAAAAIGVAAAASVLAAGAGTAFASAGGLTAPSILNNSCDTTTPGTAPWAPAITGVTCSSTQTGSFSYAGRFYPSTVQIIRSAGSDTTFFMMQSLADLYNQSALYGGTVAADNITVENGTTTDDANTDDIDNYSRTEVINGVDQIGSGAGINALCQAAPVPPTMRVDFARSSKEPVAAAPTSCKGTGSLGITGMGYAADGVPPVDFAAIIPGAYGEYMACTTADTNCANETAADGFAGYLAPGATQLVTLSNGYSFTATGASPNGSDLVGPVAQGWIPGDNINGPYSGTALVGIPNATSSGLTPAGENNGVLYRIYCETDGQANGQITDWGQLTNLTGGATIGNGTPIGIPIMVWGVNTSSGTESVYDAYINKGAATGYSTCANTNTNTPLTGVEGQANGSDRALENNASNLAQMAAGDNGLEAGVFQTNGTSAPTNIFGSTGPEGEAMELSASLYYMSYGVTQTNNAATSATITIPATNGASAASSTTFPAGVLGLYSSGALVTDSSTNNLRNVFPTARILYNAYLSSEVRASTANFLNWLADDNNIFKKLTDNNTGVNYDSEITSVIQNKYGFARLADNSPANVDKIIATGDGDSLISTVPTTLDPQSVEALSGTQVSGSTNQLTVAAPTAGYGDPVNAPVGLLVTGGNIPAGTTITASSTVSGVTTITLSNNFTAPLSASETIDVTGGLQYNQE